jgi:hypothetical protein
MKSARTAVPTWLEAGGICVQGQDWVDLNIGRIRFTRGAGATPVLVGMPQDFFQCLHRGTVFKGSIHVRLKDGSEESMNGSDVFSFSPGYKVWVEEDYKAIEVSPSVAMGQVINHLTLQPICRGRNTSRSQQPIYPVTICQTRVERRAV